MNKNIVLITISTFILAASIAFSFTQKKRFEQSLKEIKSNYKEIEYIIDLKSLWGAKGIKSKLTKIVNTISPNKKKNFLIKRSKAEIAFNSLNERELNKILSKLAMLPLQFKKLNIKRSGEQFSLECTCVW